MRLGAHVSTAGGMAAAVPRGVELGCESIQVFTRNQRQWNPKPLDPADTASFRTDAADAGFADDAVSHASYLINLCATDDATLERSRAALIDELERGAALGIPHVCVHPGSHLGAGEAAGLSAIADSVRAVLSATRGRRVHLLLENTAGQGTNLGWRLEHLEEILRRVRSRRLGICIDTCHLFAAGYDLRTPKRYERTMDELDTRLGLDRIAAFHLNDSKHPLGARRDRHEHIGEGEIGRRGFRLLLRDPRFEERPGILETPGGPDHYEENLASLRRLRGR